MDLELNQSKEFYTLGVDIYKTLHLPRNKRGEDDAILYLNKQFSNYTKLKEASNLLDKRLKVDTIASIPNCLSINNSENLNNSEITSTEDDSVDNYSSIRELFSNRDKSIMHINIGENNDNKHKNIEETTYLEETTDLEKTTGLEEKIDLESQNIRSD